MHDLIIQAPIRLNVDEFAFTDLNESSKLNFKEFKVHKLILSIRSEVFQKMFSISQQNETNSSFSFSKTPTITITDFDAFTVEIFLNYLYTDMLEINFKNFKLNLSSSCNSISNLHNRSLSDNDDLGTSSDKSSEDEDFSDSKAIRAELCTHIFIELFKISDKYYVHRLKQICENQLVNFINVGTTVELLVLAYLHNSNKLKKKCFNYLAENVSNIISQPSWTQLEKNYPALLAESFRFLYFKKRENF